jgi:hypothetical protein
MYAGLPTGKERLIPLSRRVAIIDGAEAESGRGIGRKMDEVTMAPAPAIPIHGSNAVLFIFHA